MEIGDCMMIDEGIIVLGWEIAIGSKGIVVGLYGDISDGFGASDGRKVLCVGEWAWGPSFVHCAAITSEEMASKNCGMWGTAEWCVNAVWKDEVVDMGEL